MSLRNALAAGLLLVATQAEAHHSTARYDFSHKATVSGTVRAWDWTNPHAWLWIVVSDKGHTSDVGVEFAALSIMRRIGLTRESFKAGQKVVVEIFPMKDGTPGGAFVSATVDGRPITLDSVSGQ